MNPVFHLNLNEMRMAHKAQNIQASPRVKIQIHNDIYDCQ